MHQENKTSILRRVTRKGKEPAAASTSPVTATGEITQWQLEVDFGDQEIALVPPRGEDSLPNYIKGNAQWKGDPLPKEHQSYTVIWTGDKGPRESCVEYLNQTWYLIYWDHGAQQFRVYKDDRINDP